MPEFRAILTASDAELMQLFYKLKTGDDEDFRKKINHAAALVGLNHNQLVCALGFNPNVRNLTDILSVIGFSSYKLLTYRRNELFCTDTYQQLDIENVVDIYAEHLDDELVLASLRELLLPRLANIEQLLTEHSDTNIMISYKMEVHSIYIADVATLEFINQRIQAPIGYLRDMIEEIQLIVEAGLIPPSNLFFSDQLMPREKRYLIEQDLIDQPMIKNRLANSEISEDERQVLEDFAE